MGSIEYGTIESPELNRENEILNDTKSHLEELKTEFNHSEYTIRAGDTLGRILRRYTNNEELSRESFRKGINNIQVGDVLHFYGNDGAILLTQKGDIFVIGKVTDKEYDLSISSIDLSYEVKSGDKLLEIAGRYPLSENIVLDLHRKNPNIFPGNIVEILSLNRLIVYKDNKKNEIIFKSDHTIELDEEIDEDKIFETITTTIDDDIGDYEYNKENLIGDLDFFNNLFSSHIDNLSILNYYFSYEDNIINDLNRFDNIMKSIKNISHDTDVDILLQDIIFKKEQIILLLDQKIDDFKDFNYEQFMSLDKIDRFRIVTRQDVRGYFRILFPNTELQSKVTLNDILPDYYEGVSVLRGSEIRAGRTPALTNYYGFYKKEGDGFINLFRGDGNQNNNPIILSNFIIKPYEKIDFSTDIDTIFSPYSSLIGERDAYVNEIIIRNLFDDYIEELLDNIPENSAINKNFIYSIISQESMFNPNSVSYTGVRGLGQITITTYLQNLSSMDQSDILRVGSKSTVDTELYDPGNSFQIMVNHFTSIEQRLFMNIENQELRKDLMIISYNAGENLVNNFYRSNIDRINSGEDFINVLTHVFNENKDNEDKIFRDRVIVYRKFNEDENDNIHTLSESKLYEISNHFNKSREIYLSSN